MDVNRKKRDQLGQAKEFLGKAKGLVEDVRNQEQESLDNLPDNLQDTERAGLMEDAIDSLESAMDDIDSAVKNLCDASN